jgi:hypothetical protein
MEWKKITPFITFEITTSYTNKQNELAKVNSKWFENSNGWSITEINLIIFIFYSQFFQSTIN